MRRIVRGMWVGAMVLGLVGALARGQEADGASSGASGASSGASVTLGAAGRKVVGEGIVIEDVTVISGERKVPLEHGTVVIRDGRIVEIGTNIKPGPHATRIDGRGKFLIPGLIDSHVHAGDLAPLDDN